MREKPDILALASELYGAAADKAGGSILAHAERVADFVLLQGGTEAMYEAALLHDVIEDTDTTGFDLLRFGLCPETIRLVVALTRMEGERYFDYIARVAADPQARVIKLADNLDNASRLRNLEPEDEESLGKRYEKARRILLAAR